MRLTAGEHPEAVKRYRHVKRAAPWKTRCPSICSGTSHACTLEKGHRGPHVSHGARRRILAVWEGGGGASSSGSKGRAPGPRRPIGLRGRQPADALATLRSLGGTLASMAEEIALGIFFLAFVWFAIEWLTLIFR